MRRSFVGPAGVWDFLSNTVVSFGQMSILELAVVNVVVVVVVVVVVFVISNVTIIDPYE